MTSATIGCSYEVDHVVNWLGALRFGDFVDTLGIQRLKVIAVLTNDHRGIVKWRLSTLRNNLTWLRPTAHHTSLEAIEVDEFACSPKLWLQRLCRFLGLEQDDDYLTKATALVNSAYCHATGTRSQAERHAGNYTIHRSR